MLFRSLVYETPGFIDFWEYATPLDEIKRLQIGSRPASRAKLGAVNQIRAIPWVFAWTQSRCMLPAWYGLGTALSDVKYSDRAAWQMVCEMYRQWPFLQATIDNAALALAKADMYIAQNYSELVEDPDDRQRCWGLIAREFDRTRQALIEIARIEEVIARHGKHYLERVYTPGELEQCGKRAESLAGRFAAKEAVAKALGSGIGNISWRDIEVLGDEQNAPILTLHNAAKQKASELGLTNWSEIGRAHV